MGKLNASDHREQAWRVHELARDFQLWDVWELPVELDLKRGDDFETFCGVFDQLEAKLNQMRGPVGFLFRLRERLGRLFGWDRDVNTLPIPGSEERSVFERLPAHERGDTARERDAKRADPPMELGWFEPVYLTDRERLLEISNNTCHALLHLGMVDPTDAGGHTVQLAVYVLPRGLGGRLYLMAILPFRHLLVYPSLLKNIARVWDLHARAAHAPGSWVGPLAEAGVSCGAGGAGEFAAEGGLPRAAGEHRAGGAHPSSAGS